LRYRPKVHGDFIVQCVRLIVMIVHTTVLRQIAYAALGRRTMFIGRSSDDLSLLVWWLISQNLFFFGTELRKWLYVTLLHSMYSISSRPPRNKVMFRDDGLWGQSKGWGLEGAGFWH